MNNQIRILSLATFTLYSIFNGIIYQWSFWDYFNINIMQYISINDLLPSIAISIALPIAALGAYVFIASLFINSEFFGRAIESRINKVVLYNDNFEKSGRYEIESHATKIKPKFILILVFILAVLFCLLAYAYRATPLSIIKNLVILILCVSIWHFLLGVKELRASFGKYAFPIILTLSMMPQVMLVSGTVNARYILKGKNSFIVKSESICKKDNKNEKFRFIANVSDKAFAYSLTDNSLCIFKYESLTLIKESALLEDSLTLTPQNLL